jgi:antitoxin component YwqK of YwqJK toxin-antitoxin module
MKTKINYIHILGAIFLSFAISATSCGNKQTKQENSDTLITDTIVKTDEELMSEKYIEHVLEYYDDGQVFHVEYYDIENPSEKAYERMYFRSGEKFMEGGLKNGERHGRWTAWYENGNVWSVADYYEGNEHGSNIVRYENGTIRYQKQHDMGEPHGLWKFYAPDGRLLGEVMYNQGEIEWEKDYMENVNESL